jgi:hypothetical protein
MKTKMIAFLSTSLLAGLLATSAMATGNNNGNGCRNRCGSTSTTNQGGHATQAQGQAQGQIQGQIAHGGRGGRATATGGQGGSAQALGGSGYGGRGGAGGAGGAGGLGGQGGSASSSSASSVRNSVGGQRNSQQMVYQESRERLQAPGVYGSFAGSATSPCERNTFGIGGSFPGGGGLFQVPVSSDTCWSERQADRLIAMGCSNAGLAVLAGDPVRVALANNPCGGGSRRAIRAKY